MAIMSPTQSTVVPTKVTEPTPTPTPSAIDAEIMCQRFVKDMLRSPSTASFGGWLEDLDEAEFITDKIKVDNLVPDTRTLHGSGVWLVNGEVDSENGFGAMIRSRYMCVLDDDPDSEMWYLLDIYIISR